MDKLHSERSAESSSATKIIRGLLPAALCGFCGYLSGLCALPFGVYPFGVALLASADKNAPFVFIGLLISAIGRFDGGVAATFIGVYAALLLSRVLIRLTLDFPFSRSEGKRSLRELFSILFLEKRGYRVLLATLGSFFISLSFLIGGGFLYYDLFGLLLSVVVSPIAAYILCGYFEGSREGGVDYRYELGLLVLLGICAYGASPLKIYGASVAVAGGMLVTLLISTRRSFLRGLLAAAVIGLAYSPTMTPIFLFCAFSSGVFIKISPTLISVASLAASLGYAFYVKGIYALEGTVGGAIAGCLLFSVLARISVRSEKESEKASKASKPRCRVLEEGELDSARLFDMNRRMAAMSEAFARLSDLFEEMKLRFPKIAELKSICSHGFESSCAGCAEYGRCREGDRVSLEAERLAAALERKSFVAREDFSSAIRDRCGRLPDIIDEINYNFDVRSRHTDDEGELFSEDRGYKALSGLLGRGMEDEGEEYLPKIPESSKLCRVLDRLDAGIVGVVVYGKRQMRVYIKGESRRVLEERGAEIADAVSESLGVRMDASSLSVRRCGRGEEGSLELCEAKRYRISSVVRSASKGGESYCGDCFSAFENKDGRFFSIISDGMGSGREAAAVSELTVGFMKNMLAVGGMNREILQMLNSCLRGRSDSSAHECSATLDMLELDRVSGRAVFYKCGAAPTYIYRGGRLFKLRSRTMPLGILDKTDAKVLDLELDAGDVVVMMSDGVTGGEEDCPYLFDLLRQNIESAGASRVADLILKYARSHSDDDVSVAVLRIEEESA